jgi:hypothetical protein
MVDKDAAVDRPHYRRYEKYGFVCGSSGAHRAEESQAESRPVANLLGRVTAVMIER